MLIKEHLHKLPKYIPCRISSLTASRFLHRTGLPSHRSASRYSASASSIGPNRSGPRLLQPMRPMLSLSLNKKQRRRANRQCLYCGGLGHIAMNCPHKPRRQVNQVSTHENPISISAPPSRNLSRPSSPYHKNTFDVLSQLDDVLNE